jgi:signal transduction histidine kinase
VAAVRSLTEKQAGEKIPVHLRGVVTFFDENLFSRFIQDETAGIYLQFPTNVGPPQMMAGQLVDVVGYGSPGEYAPVVMVEQISVVGEAPLPPAKPVTYEALASGTEDSQFVSISGIVHAARKLKNSEYYQIEIATGGGRLLVYAKQLPVARDQELLDSSVRVSGVCSTKFNHQRQLFAIRLMVPRPDDLKIQTPATRDPFAAPSRPIGSLLQFTPQETYGHRVKVAGTVIYFEPGSAVFLQNGKHGVEIQTQETDPLELGDHAEALGFVSQGEYTPLLQDAVYRRIFGGPPMVPARLTTDEALKGDYDCRLIQVCARLVDRTQHGEEQFLILQEGSFIFQASLKGKDGVAPFALLANDSRVAVTGVCRIEPGEWEAGENWRAKSFSLLLRTPQDVELLQAPPWWTLKRVMWMAGALGLAALVAFGWVWVLRRQVAERTRELETQIQKRQMAERRREIEQERARVAHDLHDDLGAGLTEVNMLTTLVKSPTTSSAEKERYLGDLSETARRMVTSLDEIVWAVNPRNDTIASLASYFGSYAQRLLDLAAVACGLDIAEDLPERPLDPRFRQELFFAFKEALTNVVRHALATQVWLRISVQRDCLVVELADNGKGFDLQKRQHAGEDGLVNMNDRLNALGGECQIISDPQQGTTVRLRAPLPQNFL